MSEAAVQTKKRRATQACDFCHRRGRRCDPGSGNADNQCQTCAQFGVSCTRTRIAAKRGAKPRARDGSSDRWVLDPSRHGSRSLVDSLIRTFFQDVYPIVITVHEASFMSKWNAERVPDGRACFAKLMAICALSAYRVNSGASVLPVAVASESMIGRYSYLEEALSAIPQRSAEIQDFETLQAIGIVCLTALESGNAALMHQYSGLYHAVIAEQGFCDERRWSPGLSNIEKEERRRLYWHMYRLEVHTSLVLGHVIRLPELQSAIAYPSLIDEDHSESHLDSEWLSGWNFVTDIYRGFEHLIVSFRSKRASNDMERRKLSTSFMLDFNTHERILAQLADAYLKLPARFKTAFPLSSDIRRNRCGFQAANIICTYQLMKMVSFTISEATFYQACQTALELIEEMSTLPPTYLRAMSLAMLQELAGFGHILSSFIGKELPKSDYQHLRTVLLCMSEFLESLDSWISSASLSGRKLRDYVTEIDNFLETPTVREPEQSSQLDQSGASDDFASDEIFVPFEFLQRIPWPGDWAWDGPDIF